MTTERKFVEVRGITVEVVRKPIKHLHLGVYPPAGRVRVAVPMRIDDEAVRLAVITRLSWIRKRQQVFLEQARQSQREMLTGESHYVWGERHRLQVIEQAGGPRVWLERNHRLVVQVRQGTPAHERRALLDRWYRAALKEAIPTLIAKWEPMVSERVTAWGVKRMKTKWGSCNADARRIWLNLELAKKPRECLEYVLVHEMVHLLERRHNDHFRDLMDSLMPTWRLLRGELNRAPLAHEDWTY